jgi:aerobic-type carbon monoxide dehydrogenase small subunit (CoxS/CutS family)
MLGRVVPASQAISERISWNICRGTATSAIWNVT